MKRLRIYLFLTLMVLLGVGIVMIYSSSSVYAWRYQGDSLFYLKRHLCYLLVGFIAMFTAMALDLSWVKKHSKLILLISLVLLCLTILPGFSRQVAGARRWIRVGAIGFQPSEFVKVAFIIYIADFLSRKQKIVNDFFRGAMPLLIVLAAPVFIILLQPDLGTAFSLVCVTFIMLFIAGLDIKYFFSAVLLGLPVLYLLVFSVPYRRARILAFLNPWADPRGAGFQIIQSQIALGSGGLFGLGIGQGRQKLFYLPAAHTDFIFSVVGEELGIAGGVALVAVFIFLLLQMAKIARLCKDNFSKFLSMGFMILIGIEAIINIAVSLGLVPTKGLPLPFVSYGGSALVFNMAAVGLLLNASRKEEMSAR